MECDGIRTPNWVVGERESVRVSGLSIQKYIKFLFCRLVSGLTAVQKTAQKDRYLPHLVCG